jgi:hypothetical protein
VGYYTFTGNTSEGVIVVELTILYYLPCRYRIFIVLSSPESNGSIVVMKLLAVGEYNLMIPINL